MRCRVGWDVTRRVCERRMLHLSRAVRRGTKCENETECQRPNHDELLVSSRGRRAPLLSLIPAKFSLVYVCRAISTIRCGSRSERVTGSSDFYIGEAGFRGPFDFREACLSRTPNAFIATLELLEVKCDGSQARRPYGRRSIHSPHHRAER